MTNEDWINRENVTFILPDDMPLNIRGMSYCDDDGNWIVVINPKHSYIQNHRTADHEMLHLRRGDNTNHTYHEYGGRT